MSRTIKAAEFKQTCLALMDEVAERGETILITKRGKIVAKLGPAFESRPQALGCLKHALEVLDEDFSLPEWTVHARKGRG
jgi:antitoxin (DNA-binding transcriptional repressor) of toxin-antitoxin stability system